MRIPELIFLRQFLFLHFLFFLSRTYILISDPMDLSSDFLIFSLICSVSLLFPLNFEIQTEIHISKLIAYFIYFIICLISMSSIFLFFNYSFFISSFIFFPEALYYLSKDINDPFLFIVPSYSASFPSGSSCLLMCLFFLVFSV